MIPRDVLSKRMTVEKLVELQTTDEELKPLFAFLEEWKLPNTKRKSRRL